MTECRSFIVQYIQEKGNFPQELSRFSERWVDFLEKTVQSEYSRLKRNIRQDFHVNLLNCG